MDDKEKLVQSYSVSRNGKHVFCYINNTGGFENKIIQDMIPKINDLMD